MRIKWKKTLYIRGYSEESGFLVANCLENDKSEREPYDNDH
ncbi:MAG: hypothetical protein Ct9H300mP9_5510 [Candidatus Neomarinimicrobiota bacterium]|nr:MAG: hypothetical protein Ct9H300mP9_5510 [Candidatus Neomarinimicrobiota bacterium]